MSNLSLSQCENVFISCTLLKNTFPVFEFIIGRIKNVFHVGIPVIPEAVLVNNPEMMDHPPAVGNSSGHQNLSSSTGPIPDSGKMQMIHFTQRILQSNP
jgi:hypothetical protein